MDCGFLGHPWGCCWPCSPPDWKPLDPPSQDVLPGRAAGLCSGHGSVSAASPGCAGSILGCRQQQCTQLPPCMVPGGREQAVGAHSTAGPGPGLQLQAGAAFALPQRSITDGALQLLCRLQAGSWRRLGRPISGIGMCGLKSILLVQLSAARCQGLRAVGARGWREPPPHVTHPPAFPLFSSTQGPAVALVWGWLSP